MSGISKISETGFWSGDNAHVHHVHSKPLSDWICKFLAEDKDKRIYDCGAGLGNYLKDLADADFTDLVGFEGDIPVNKAFAGIWKQDLTKPIDPTVFRKKGNVLFLEVGEHISAEFQDQLLQNIKYLCNGYLIMSWAVRGQVGFGHVNCLDNGEVTQIMEKYGFKYLHGYSQDARVVIDDTTPWFKNTIMIFSRWK